MSEELCHCGKPLHYSTPDAEATAKKMVANFGPYIRVWVGNRCFKVQKHYIMLHGVKGEDIPKLGFHEYTQSELVNELGL